MVKLYLLTHFNPLRFNVQPKILSVDPQLLVCSVLSNCCNNLVEFNKYVTLMH